jgi:hypothetical protein
MTLDDGGGFGLPERDRAEISAELRKIFVLHAARRVRVPPPMVTPSESRDRAPRRSTARRRRVSRARSPGRRSDDPDLADQLAHAGCSSASKPGPVRGRLMIEMACSGASASKSRGRPLAEREILERMAVA